MPPVQKLQNCFDCEGTGKVRAIKCPDCTDGQFKHGEYLYVCQNCDESPAGAGWEFLNEDCAQQPHEVKRNCLSCDGIGYSVRQHGNMKIGEANYSMVYVAMFAALPQVRVCPGDPASSTYGSNKTTAPAVFVFDGGHGLLMPRTE